MNYHNCAKPLITTVVVFVAVWISSNVYLSVAGGIPGFAFLAITSALLGGLFHFVYRDPRLPESRLDLVENIPGLAWISESNGRIISMSSPMRNFLQVPPGSLVVAAGSIHPEDRQKTLDLWSQHHRSGAHSTHRLLGPDGHYHWFRSAMHPVRDQNGAIVSLWGTFIDIDDLKAAEQALRSSEENLRSILDNIPGQIVTADSNGVNDYCNRISELFYGHSFHEINGMGFTRFIHPDDVEKFAADSFNCIANSIPMDQPVRQLRHDGVYRWFRMRVNPAFDDNGKVSRWYGLHSDIDDEVKTLEALRDAQDKLAQASQYASLAELAASIAHEVSQPLSAIVTNSEVCQLWLLATPPNLERARISADRIVSDAQDAANIVGRIRELFGKKAPHKERININEVIDDVVQLIRKKHANGGLNVSSELDPAIPEIVADKIQIQQLTFNILSNGVEAMRSNGEEPRILNVRSRFAEDTVIVEVTDNGGGLADPHKIFEPFFTTKTDGMGMGLSICRSIVDAHNGRLWAEAGPMRGAAFAFELPIQDQDAVFLEGRDRYALYEPDVEKL